MGIGFAFRTQPCDASAVFTQLEQYAEKKGYWAYRDDDEVRVVLCRTGDILLESKDGCITGDCQTNVAGAGFHVAALSFMEEFAKDAGLELQLEDETDYHEHRDFARMRREHFYKCLENLLKVMVEHIEKTDDKALCICWSTGQYMPKSVKGTIVSPMGRFTVEKLLRLVEEQGIEAFAQEFFLWNEKEKDARFYRNSALGMLWEECYFMPSSRSEEDERVNGQIVRFLEQALQMDNTLPFPREEYLLLCQLHGSQPLSLDGVPDYHSEHPVGFRRDTVTNRLGNITYPVPGYYLFESQQDGRDNVYYDGQEQGWRSLRLTAFGTQVEQEDFSDSIFQDAAELSIEFAVGDGKCKAAFVGEIREDGEIYYQSVAQILSGTQITLITLSYQNREDKAWALELLQSIKANIPKENK